MTLKIDVSPGELIDKLTILEIKLEKIADPEKRRNVAHEYQILGGVLGDAANEAVTGLREALKAVNDELWDVMDEMHDHEARGDFGADFIRTARTIPQANDRRADIKRRINALLDSRLVEEKSYGRK